MGYGTSLRRLRLRSPLRRQSVKFGLPITRSLDELDALCVTWTMVALQLGWMLFGGFLTHAIQLSEPTVRNVSLCFGFGIVACMLCLHRPALT